MDEYKEFKTVAHGGGDTGFRSILLLVPEKSISVMIACNYGLTSISTHDIAHSILDILFEEKTN